MGDSGYRGRDLRKPIHFRVDEPNRVGVEQAVEQLGMTKNQIFNDALDLWLNQPHIRAALATSTEEERHHVGA